MLKVLIFTNSDMKQFLNQSTQKVFLPKPAKRKEMECLQNYFRFSYRPKTKGTLFSYRFFYKYDDRILPFSPQIRR